MKRLETQEEITETMRAVFVSWCKEIQGIPHDEDGITWQGVKYPWMDCESKGSK